MGSSAEWRCRHSLRRFADLHQSVSSVSLVSSGLPEGGRIPPGGYPSSFATALASFYARHHIVFSCTRRICDFRLVQGRSSLGPDRELFIQRLDIQNLGKWHPVGGVAGIHHQAVPRVLLVHLGKVPVNAGEDFIQLGPLEGLEQHPRRAGPGVQKGF